MNRFLVLLLSFCYTCVAQEFSGIQQNIATSTLSNWDECWREGFETSLNTTLTDLFEVMCYKERLLIGCRKVGDDNLVVAAEALRNDALHDTGRSNTPRTSNGISWYFNSSWSMGFAPAGEAINRISCDYDFYDPQTLPHLRFCMQTKDGYVSNGFRCGNNTFLGADENWERIIFHADPLTSLPSTFPTSSPSTSPSILVSDLPTSSPSRSPTFPVETSATFRPSESPSSSPSSKPSSSPTTLGPSSSPAVFSPSANPSSSPSSTPSSSPTTLGPSSSPAVLSPSAHPSSSPSSTPSSSPAGVLQNARPSVSPSSLSPTTSVPTSGPSFAPTFKPSKAPRTSKPTHSPSTPTTHRPTTSPSPMPTVSPTHTDQFFPGVKNDIDLTKYYKWEKCWEEQYSVSNTTTSEILLGTLCTKKRLMVACRAPETPNIASVAAQAAREDVTFETDFVFKLDNQNQPTPINAHIANGVAWYWNTSHSFGFAPAGQNVILDDCDITDAADRMCVHYNLDYVYYGYRCGLTKQGDANSWYRMMLQTDESQNDF